MLSFILSFLSSIRLYNYFRIGTKLREFLQELGRKVYKLLLLIPTENSLQLRIPTRDSDSFFFPNKFGFLELWFLSPSKSIISSLPLFKPFFVGWEAYEFSTLLLEMIWLGSYDHFSPYCNYISPRIFSTSSMACILFTIKGPIVFGNLNKCPFFAIKKWT